MSISSGSSALACSGVPSSSSSDSSAMSHTDGPSPAHSGSICFVEFVVAVGAQATPSSRPRRVFVAEVMNTSSNEPSRTERGRVALACAWMQILDCHVEGLQERRAVRRDEAQHDVRERRRHGGRGGLTGLDAGHVPERDPHLFFLARVQHVVQCGRGLQDRCRRCPAVVWRDVMSVLRPRLSCPRTRSAPACHARVASPSCGWDGRRIPLRRASRAPSH